MANDLVQLSFRIDRDLRDSTNAVLDEIGLSMQDAIRVFFKKITKNKGIPFKLEVSNNNTSIDEEEVWDERRYKPEVVNELLESKKNYKTFKSYKTAEELFKDLEIK